MECNKIKHIAFIMDGNGRWAKKRLMPREYGHKVGAEKFREIVKHCGDIGIETVTVYAFSTDNWKRPKKEVDAIISLFSSYIGEAKKSDKKIRIRFLGNKNAFDEKMRNDMLEIEEKTKHYDRNLCIAMNYSGRGEIVDAVNDLIKSGKTSITEDDITGAIYSGEFPPPDMIVRTSGEYRLSNFLMWQSSYSELFFTNTLWPDLTIDEVDSMINEFSNRKRRFGGV